MTIDPWISLLGVIGQDGGLLPDHLDGMKICGKYKEDILNQAVLNLTCTLLQCYFDSSREYDNPPRRHDDNHDKRICAYIKRIYGYAMRRHQNSQICGSRGAV